MTMSPYNTSLPLPGALMPQSIITEYYCDITDISYSAEAHLYCSTRVFPYFTQ